MEKNQQDDVRKRRHLTPEEKYQIFLEATLAKARDNGGISEVLRRWGIHSSDLNRIRQTVEEGAIGAFRVRKSRKPTVDYTQFQELKSEKERLESTVLELAAEVALLKKKDRLA